MLLHRQALNQIRKLISENVCINHIQTHNGIKLLVYDTKVLNSIRTMEKRTRQSSIYSL